jgi:hypothetical protein
MIVIEAAPKRLKRAIEAGMEKLMFNALLTRDQGDIRGTSTRPHTSYEIRGEHAGRPRLTCREKVSALQGLIFSTGLPRRDAA